MQVLRLRDLGGTRSNGCSTNTTTADAPILSAGSLCHHPSRHTDSLGDRVSVQLAWGSWSALLCWIEYVVWRVMPWTVEESSMLVCAERDPASLCLVPWVRYQGSNALQKPKEYVLLAMPMYEEMSRPTEPTWSLESVTPMFPAWLAAGRLKSSHAKGTCTCTWTSGQGNAASEVERISSGN